MSTAPPAPPRNPDLERTDPGRLIPELAEVLAAAERGAVVREVAELRAIVEALRATIAPVVAADARWAQARALVAEAAADGLRAPLPVVGVRVGSVSLLGLAGAMGLGLLSLAGVAVDLPALADAAAHAWSGEPHVVQCEVPASGPLSPAPSGVDGPG